MHSLVHALQAAHWPTHSMSPTDSPQVLVLWTILLKPLPSAKLIASHRFLGCVAMLRYAMQVCVVSRGSKACLVSSCNGQVLSCTPPEVTVVDTVGAGDCFAAGFLHAYLTGASLQVNPLVCLRKMSVLPCVVGQTLG